MRPTLLAALLVSGCAARTTLTKDDVLDTVKARGDAFRACQSDGTRTARARLVIQPDGGVADVRVEAPPGLETQAACAAGVLRDLRFEPFAGDPIDVELPIPL
jgi:hypothetical protein